MIEFVKIVFCQVQKIRDGEDSASIKKSLTANCYEKLMGQKEQDEREQRYKVFTLKKIAILKVQPATDKHPDCFTALLSGYELLKNKDLKNVRWNKPDDCINGFEAQWTFLRQGNWWLLGEIKASHFSDIPLLQKIGL